MSEPCPECGRAFDTERGAAQHRKQAHTPPWRDKDKLRKAWGNSPVEQSEVAEMWGCHKQTIQKWVGKHGIKKKWQREEWLREEYVENERTTVEMADEVGVEPSTISKNLEKHGINRRDNSNLHATYRTTERGYAQWECSTNGEYVLVHRLLAIAEYGFETVTDKDVHHINEVRYDNRHENIEPLSRSEHMEKHA